MSVLHKYTGGGGQQRDPRQTPRTSASSDVHGVPATPGGGTAVPVDGPSPVPLGNAASLDEPCIATTSGTAVLMLDLVFRRGERLALGYSYLVSVAFDPSNALVLTFVSHTVTITGRNLERAYTALRAHACLRLAEWPQEFAEHGTHVHVAEITVEDREGDAPHAESAAPSNDGSTHE